MSFMQPQVTGKRQWYKMEGTQGIVFVDREDAGFVRTRKDGKVPNAALHMLHDYYPGSLESAELIQGYGARLSAPGYLDCTEWDVFATREEAEKHLAEEYGTDEEESE